MKCRKFFGRIICSFRSNQLQSIPSFDPYEMVVEQVIMNNCKTCDNVAQRFDQAYTEYRENLRLSTETKNSIVRQHYVSNAIEARKKAIRLFNVQKKNCDKSIPRPSLL